MINKVILVGNLGADPEIRNLESGAKVAKLSVATNENYQDKNGEWQKITEWHNVVAWRRLADSAERNLKKGGMVYIEGKLTNRKWQDQNGQDRYTTEIVANDMQMLGGRSGAGGGFESTAPMDPPAAGAAASQPQQSPQQAPQQAKTAAPAGGPDISFDDDIPF